MNRNGRSCRALYDAARSEQGKQGPSLTRRNLDALRRRLARHGVTGVLETNVVCYSSPMSSDLAEPRHRGGKVRGAEIFTWLLSAIEPRILIAHGAKTKKVLSRLLGVSLPDLPRHPAPPRFVRASAHEVVAIPSLAPPAWTKWAGWAPTYLDDLAVETNARLEQQLPEADGRESWTENRR